MHNAYWGKGGGPNWQRKILCLNCSFLALKYKFYFMTDILKVSVKMKSYTSSYWSRAGPNTVIDGLIKRGKFGHTGKCQVMTEDEIGMMQLQTREGQGMPSIDGNTGSQRKVKSVLPRDSGGAWPHPHLDFGLPASRHMKEYISAVLSHPVCSTLLHQS